MFIFWNGKFLHISKRKHCLPSATQEGFTLRRARHSPVCEATEETQTVPSKWTYTVCIRACASA